MSKFLRRRNKYGLLGILLVIPLFLSGCWDSLDIEKRAIILGISIDKAEDKEEGEEEYISHLPGKFPAPENNMIKLSAQIAVPGKIPLGPQSGGGEEKPVWVVEVVGHTIDDALSNLQQEIANDLFLGHLRVIVLSEDIAKEGLESFNDFLRRNSEIRRTAWLTVSQGKASEFMKIVPKLERVPALYVSAMVENAVDLGKFPSDFIGQFWSIFSSKGQDSYLPYLTIKKEENIQIAGLAYFKGEKMIGVTNPMEIGFFMAVVGEEQGGYGAFVQVPGTEDYVMVRARKRRTRIKSEIKNGVPHFNVHLYYESEIDEKDGKKVEVSNSKVISTIEKEASKGVVESVEAFIKKTQEEQSDIFGFGEQIRAKHPFYWDRNIKTLEKWHEVYQDMVVTVECTSEIRRVGMKSE
jgi:spore germination protein KC